jgi:ATP-binding cassette, subfamily B, bacterial MsbA
MKHNGKTPTEARAPLLSVIRVVRDLFVVRPSVVMGLVLLGLVTSLIEGVGISLFIPLLHSLSPDSNVETAGRFIGAVMGWTDGISPEARLPLIVALIVLAVILKTFLSFGYGAWNGHITSRAGHGLRVSLFERLQAADYRYLENVSYGRLLNGMATESWRATDALNVLFGLYISICTAVVYIVLLLVLSWELTFLVAIAMVGISWVARRAARRVESLGKEATEANSVLAQRISDGLAGIKQIRIFGREPYELERFRKTSSHVADTFWRLGVIGGFVSPIFEILTTILIGGVLLFQFGSAEDLPALLVFLFVLYRLKPRIEQIDRARVNLSGLHAAAKEIRALMAAPLAPDTSDGLTLAKLEKDIRFDDVTFRYGIDDSAALTQVSFRIPVNMTTAIVGPSGAGKSTVLKLLLRLYDPERGSVLIGDHSIPDIRLADWRRLLGVVSQEAYLFDATVSENIAYGRADATHEEVVQAAQLAHAHDFIEQLPAGYDTRVNERGVRLSGGQQQRITLARALVRDPDLLILDEATNNLDALSERLVQDALEAFGGERTVVVVAHRLSTIEGADHIVVLQDGRVAEEGPFDELRERGGLFTSLYRAQSFPA